MDRCILMICVAALISGTHGCAVLSRRPQKDYRTVDVDTSHETEKARRKNSRALKLIEQCPPGDVADLYRAEQVLQEALAADVTYGPAHNNLGKVYFHQQKFYLAAWEFEYAMKLMPDRSEPINNLGRVYEEVGKYDKAMELYGIAYKAAPRNPEVIGNLARCGLRRGDPIESIILLLEDLILFDHRQEWVDWAKEQLHFYQIKTSAGPGPWETETPVDATEEDELEIVPRPPDPGPRAMESTLPPVEPVPAPMGLPMGLPVRIGDGLGVIYRLVSPDSDGPATELPFPSSAGSR